MLVKKKGDDAQHLYAMKTLRKAALIKRNQLAHTSTERTILQKIKCPFLVHLIFAFQTTDKLYMVLDYMAGGELFFWLKKDRKFSEPRVQLYTAEITIALEALHAADIVYRDLKPENILLDSVGHLRLTDFGLAKGGITGYGSEGNVNFETITHSIGHCFRLFLFSLPLNSSYTLTHDQRWNQNILRYTGIFSP